jgi:GT2 family glycosyltransferase
MGEYLIAAIILTYNDSVLTAQLCQCLYEQNEVDYIVIVDNSDNAFIKATNANDIPAIASNVTYIQASLNEGYAAGNNIGINYILKNTDAEYIWIINNDIIPQKNAALSMVEMLQSHHNKAICGSVLLYDNEGQVPHEAAKLQCYGGGVYYAFIGKSKLLFKNLPLRELKNKRKRKPDFIMGASMMVNKSIFSEIGLLPEEYFMYFEELDWQTVAKKHNYELIVAESSLVFHLDSLSTKNKRHTFYYLLNRASIIFTKKYYKIFLPFILLFRAMEAIVFVPNKKNKLYSLKGLYNGLVFTRKRS